MVSLIGLFSLGRVVTFLRMENESERYKTMYRRGRMGNMKSAEIKVYKYKVLTDMNIMIQDSYIIYVLNCICFITRM